LLPVGTRTVAGVDRPRAVSEYLIERLVLGGADRICFVIPPGQSDILQYFGARVEGADVCYVVQGQPAGLCDALFQALPLVGDADAVRVGLPDTIWFPADALRALPDHPLSFLCFPVDHPERFDAVVIDEPDRVREIRVK